MSKPITDVAERDALQSAMCEVVSGISALNMYPEPNGKEGFLSQTDEMAKHSIEHFSAAFDLLCRTQSYVRWLENELHKTEIRLLEKNK